MVESFWAIPDVTEIRTPVSVLREQAAALTEQTKGTIVGIVETHPESGGNLSIRLVVSVPALNDYRYRILAYNQPIELYPGILWSQDKSDTIKDETGFIVSVKNVLSSQRVKNVLTSLLSQAVEA